MSAGGGRGAGRSSGRTVIPALSQRDAIHRERQGWSDDSLWVPVRRTHLGEQWDVHGRRTTLRRFRLEVSKASALGVSNCWNTLPEAAVDFLTCSISVWNLTGVRLGYRGLWALHSAVLGLPEMLWGAARGDCCVRCRRLSGSSEMDWSRQHLSHAPPHVGVLLVTLLFLFTCTRGLIW